MDGGTYEDCAHKGACMAEQVARDRAWNEADVSATLYNSPPNKLHELTRMQGRRDDALVCVFASKGM